MDWLEILQKILLSCIITVGWCLMFTLPKRYIIHCIMVTALGFGLKQIMVAFGVHLAVSTFFGAMAGSFLGVHFAQRYGLPPKALIVPSLICMMPGIAAYKAMVSMVQIGYFGFSMDLFIVMMSHFFDAIFVISALVLGLSIPGILFYRRKPIV
ncbi:threonine/serine exporter family protein [Moraxella canis]|uniref:Threonine/serine exporter family protein n=1 Tax=Moraxella canis TaxID=90239 RepID=A0ABZ0WYE6_9GAMM|nr:threonine/serine exporter family protein [Moraxella canis]WQE04291.1 threonine/serine exporter family protein [Moraxella canis]